MQVRNLTLPTGLPPPAAAPAFVPTDSLLPHDPRNPRQGPVLQPPPPSSSQGKEGDISCLWKHMVHTNMTCMKQATCLPACLPVSVACIGCCIAAIFNRENGCSSLISSLMSSFFTIQPFSRCCPHPLEHCCPAGSSLPIHQCAFVPSRFVLQQGNALRRLLLSGIQNVQSKNSMLAFSLQHHSSSQWIPGSPGQDQRASPASPCLGQGLLPASPPPLALQVRGSSPGDRPPPSVSSSNNSSSSSSPLRFTPIPLLTPCPLALLVA